MQIFLLSSRSTASGNGMGRRGPTLAYKTGTRGASDAAFPTAALGGPMLSDADGERAVRWARATLERALTGSVPVEPEGLSPTFEERRGTFVTLRRSPSGDLRGCIGFAMPVLPLGRAVAEASLAAAQDDPRFVPVRAAELGHLTIEVSVLSVPVPVPAGAPAETAAAVQVGRDGLIVEGHGTSGLLLPQVGPEQGWSAEELLAGTCEKAGLPPDAWRGPGVRIRRFEAEVFTEVTPRGAVVRERPPVTPTSGRSSR
jgi:uncharacterized protein